MSRFSRRTRRNAKSRPPKEQAPTQGDQIRLVNPVSEHFPAFIFGNSTYCEHVVQRNDAVGKTVAICGAGPSLADDADEWLHQADEVWGCNSALTWLQEHGHNPTHGFTVDQTAHMLGEWYDAPDVEYLLASTVHPHLTEYLMSLGRRITFFHNYVGIQRPPVEVTVGWDEASPRAGSEVPRTEWLPYEEYMYSALYEPTVKTGSGLNAVTRAIDLAQYRGFGRILVLGADSALRVSEPPPNVPHGSPKYMAWLRECTVMHADGGNALASDATAVTLAAEIDGRLWVTKPDMAISAVWLVQMARVLGNVEMIGDTLPNALVDKDDEYLARLPSLTNSDGTPVRFELGLQEGYPDVE